MTTNKNNPTDMTNISTKFTPPENQSKWIQREVERLMVTERYEEGYAMYKSDPLITEPVDFDTFVSQNR